MKTTVQNNFVPGRPLPSRVCARCALALAMLLALLLAACSPSPAPDWRLDDSVEGKLDRLKFSLVNDQGRPVTAQDYSNQVVVLYFGYTHCPDVCPLTMARLNAAVERLDDSSRVKVLFVSVDPERDTVNVLHTYVRAFNQDFVGLTGSKEQIERVANRYHIGYELGKPDANGDYAVAHGAGVYVFDKRGNARLVAMGNLDSAAISHDLALLLADK